MDTIHIEGLKVLGSVGVYPWEKKIQSTLLISLKTEIQVAHIAETDDIANTVDYAQLANEIQLFCQLHRFTLIETLGYRLLSHLKKKFCLNSTSLRIDKPGFLRSAQNLSVSIGY